MTLRNRPWLLTITACLLLFILLAFIKFTQIRAAIAFGESFPEPSETVHSQVTQLSRWQPRVKVVGEIRASREVQLRTEISGVVAAIGFKSGEPVEQGRVLLQLDIAEEKARLAALEPQIDLAKKDVARLAGAVKRRSVSQQLADQASSNLAVLKAQAVSVKEIIANKTVIAPFEGKTGLHDYEVGEYVDAGALVTRLVGGLDTLWVDFALPQQYANFQAGGTVFVERPQNSIESNDPSLSMLTAQVIAVEPSISNGSRTLNARAEIRSNLTMFKPGAIVSVSAPIGQELHVVRLPSTSIRVDAFGSFVYVLNKDANGVKRAERKPVKLLAKQGTISIISAQLGAGLEVATVGSFKLRDGILTHVKVPLPQNPSQTQAQVKAQTQEIASTPEPEAANNPLNTDPVEKLEEPATSETQVTNEEVKAKVQVGEKVEGEE